MMGRMLTTVVAVLFGITRIFMPFKHLKAPPYLSFETLECLFIGGLFGAWLMYHHFETHDYIIARWKKRPVYLLWCSMGLFAWETLVFVYHWTAH